MSTRACKECGRALADNAAADASLRLTELLEVLELRQQQPGESERDHYYAAGWRYESQLIHARVVIASVCAELGGICVFCTARRAAPPDR